MPTPQTQEEVKQTLHRTKWWVWYYKKRAGMCWQGHKVIRLFLFSEVIFEFIVLLVLQNKPNHNGDKINLWIYGLEIGILVMLVATLLCDFISKYTRKAEVFDIANMECRLVKVQLKALLDKIKKPSDDEIRRKHRELARKVTEVTKWVKEATM